MDMEQHLMEIDSIRKHYGDRQILSDIYLKLKTGDICALMGRNGSGKSTLLKIIFGSLHADSKFIRINDEVLQKPYKRSEYIAYLPSFHFLPSDLKVGKVLKMYHISEELFDETVFKLMDKRISSLSSGEQRYIELFLILNKESHFILLDEPFNFLSPLMGEHVEKMILQKSKYSGIIIADHQYRNVLKVANRILLLKDGYLQELDSTEELKTKGYLL